MNDKKSLLLCSTTQTIKSYDGNHQRILKTDMSNHSEKATGTRECISCLLLRNYRSHAVTACQKNYIKNQMVTRKVPSSPHQTILTIFLENTTFSQFIFKIV